MSEQKQVKGLRKKTKGTDKSNKSNKKRVMISKTFFEKESFALNRILQKGIKDGRQALFSNPSSEVLANREVQENKVPNSYFLTS